MRDRVPEPRERVLDILRQHWPESGGQSGHQAAQAAQVACAEALLASNVLEA